MAAKSDTKSQFLRSLEHKKAAEKTAIKWVERLLEPSIPPPVLEEAAHCLEPRHYSDVIEERFIEKLCGWPLCDQILTDIPIAKYHISMKQRKVLDISDRKRFCSLECYRSSNYISSQLSTDPVWTRKSSFKIKLKFLDVEGMASSKAPTDGTGHTCIESGKETTPVREENVDPMMKLLYQSVKKTNPYPGSGMKGSSQESDNVIIVERMHAVTIEEGDSDDSDDVSDEEEKQKKKDLKETVSSGNYLVAPGSSHEIDNASSSKEKIRTALRHWVTGETVKWLREYLKEDGQTMSCSDDQLEEQIQKEKTQTADERHGPEVYLPPVHGVETSQIQRTIFMQQLQANLSQVAHQLELNNQSLIQDVSSFARTFRLTNANIVFKPSEWKVIICVILIRLRVAIADLQSNDHILKWLSANKLTVEDLDDFVAILTSS